MSYDLLFQQAIKFHQDGDFNNAEQIYRQLLETTPHQPDILNLLGLIAQTKNIHQEAISLFYQAIQADDKRPQFYFNLGISLHLWNKPYEALEAFEKSAKLDNSIKETWLEIGNIYRELKQIEKAKLAYTQALNIDNQYIDALIYMALLNYSPFDTLAQLQQLKKIYPQTIQIDFHIGKIYFHQQNYTQALPHLTLAAQHFATHEEANSLLGQTLLAINDNTSAKNIFLRTLEIAPNNLPALINLGNIATTQKDYLSAEKYFLRAIDIDKKNFDAHHNYATMLYHQKRISEALEEYRQALIINPQSAEACNNLGLILRDQNDLDEALGLFFNALSLKPLQDEISVNISETLIIKYQSAPQDAKKIADNWLKQYPNNIFAQHTISALNGNNRTNNQEYTQKLFDNFAPDYEATLANINYQVPTQIRKIIGNITGNILDLGCGTGLTGQLIKSTNNTLYGVDISSNMLQIAQQKNIYEQLEHQDIIQYLKNNTIKFEFIIAADVFCYISDLQPILELCSPTPLCFSIESAEYIDNYQITISGRYKHSPSYVKQLLSKYGYTQIAEYPLTLRNENHIPVQGIIFLAQK
ncbi:MAG: tetratricopeptide repeat protein [Alphaproteobacteria bacterium]|nr:tetratricopeptide repeat protein [Alphaproteobacteria bacterium]